ncbi:MAG: efflux RND transporter periplasmic adaptor subunit [Candidatus Binatia bacterium]
MSELNHYSSGVRFALLGGVITIFASGLGLGIRVSGKSTAQNIPDPPPAFSRQGERIIIPERSALRSRLQVEPVTVINSPHVLQLPATVEADPARTINILPPVAGKVVKLNVQLGDQVEQDQPLAVIDSGDLAQAYADDDKARSALKRAKSGLERARGVHESGGGPLKDVQQAEDDYAQAVAEYNRAEARLKEIGVSSATKAQTRLLTIVAPLSGTVTTLTTGSSAFANDLTASLMTISNLDSVWVTAMVPESNLAFISKGQSVDVSFVAWPDQVFHGAVSFVSAVVEPDTRRTKVRIAFANPEGRLKPNMFATAKFNIPQTSAVFVPDSALLMNNDRITVLVETEPWTFARRSVLPGYGEGDGTRIDQGLNADDRIVVKGGGLLND